MFGDLTSKWGGQEESIEDMIVNDSSEPLQVARGLWHVLLVHILRFVLRADGGTKSGRRKL